MKTLRAEKYATGKYDVLTVGEYPRRVGHITGARDTWLPEIGYEQLRYQKTLKAAVDAIGIRLS
jgi:hypothetical protein